MSLSEFGWPKEVYELASAVDKRVVELMSPLLYRVTMLEAENDALWDVLRGTPGFAGMEDMVKKRAIKIMVDKLKGERK